jgi:hypothetical protein
LICTTHATSEIKKAWWFSSKSRNPKIGPMSGTEPLSGLWLWINWDLAYLHDLFLPSKQIWIIWYYIICDLLKSLRMRSSVYNHVVSSWVCRDPNRSFNWHRFFFPARHQSDLGYQDLP